MKINLEKNELFLMENWVITEMILLGSFIVISGEYRWAKINCFVAHLELIPLLCVFKSEEDIFNIGLTRG